MNKVCQYYKQPLEDGIEACPSCGQPVLKTDKKTNTNLSVIAALVSIASILIFWGWNMYVGYVVVAASVVAAFISKSIPSVIVTFVSLAVIVLLTLRFTL